MELNKIKKNVLLVDPAYLAGIKQINLSEAEARLVTKIQLINFNLQGKVIIKGFINLELLNLAVNEITELEINEDSCSKLQKIDLSSNCLTDLNFLQSLNSQTVTSLLLKDNYLKEVKMTVFSPFIFLTKLDLSNKVNDAKEAVKGNSVLPVNSSEIEEIEEIEDLIKRIGNGLNLENANVVNAEAEVYSNLFNNEKINCWCYSLPKYIFFFFFVLGFSFLQLFLYRIVRKNWKRYYKNYKINQQIKLINRQ